MNNIERTNHDTTELSASNDITPAGEIINQKTSSLPTLAELPSCLLFENRKVLMGEESRESSNRETKHSCQIRAKNDIEAVQCWLDEYKDRPATYRTYQKEAERFVLWCI